MEEQSILDIGERFQLGKTDIEAEEYFIGIME
jgi:hypothetical protein